MDIDDGTTTAPTTASTTAGGASVPPEPPFKVHFVDEIEMNAKIALSSDLLGRVQGAVRDKLLEAQELLVRNNDVIKG